PIAPGRPRRAARGIRARADKSRTRASAARPPARRSIRPRTRPSGPWRGSRAPSRPRPRARWHGAPTRRQGWRRPCRHRSRRYRRSGSLGGNGLEEAVDPLKRAVAHFVNLAKDLMGRLAPEPHRVTLTQAGLGAPDRADADESVGARRDD